MFTRLVLPPRVPENDRPVMAGAVGTAGIPRAASDAAAGGSKNRGNAGGAKVTPPWMPVSWPGEPVASATASWYSGVVPSESRNPTWLP